MLSSLASFLGVAKEMLRVQQYFLCEDHNGLGRIRLTVQGGLALLDINQP